MSIEILRRQGQWLRWLGRCCLVLCGCDQDRPGADGWPELAAYDEPPVISPQQPQVPGEPSVAPRSHDRGAVLGFTGRAELALFDSSTGAVLATAGASGEALGRDLALDRRHSRVLVLESDADGSSSNIWSYPLVVGEPRQLALGTRELRASIEGAGRIWPAPTGLVVFEPSNGPRWRLLGDDGEPLTSVLAPLPLAAWAREHADGTELGALGLETSGARPELVVARTWLASGAMKDFVLEPTGLGPGRLPATARMAPLPADLRISCEAARREARHAGLEATSHADASNDDGAPAGSGASWCSALDGLVLVDVRAGELAFRLLGAEIDSSAVVVPDLGPIGRVEQLLVLPGLGPRDELRIAVLASQPSRLLVASLALRENRIEIDDRAVIALRGGVRTEDQFFSRDLLAVGADRLLAATSAGVEAVRVLDMGELELDDHFEGAPLRGPLGGPACRID